MDETLVVLVRGIIGFITLLIFARVLGKQQISQLTFFDYVLGITIGSVAATFTTNLNSRAWIEWFGLFIWTMATLIVQLVVIRSRYLDKFMGSQPAIVIMNGQIMEAAMKKSRYRLSDLLEQLRLKDVFDISQVEFAIVETNGQLSVLKKSQYQPATPKDLQIPTSYQGLSVELIYSGILVEENLKNLHLDRPWLEAKLSAMGIDNIADVFFASLDTQGTLYVDTYKDHIKTPIDVSDFKGPY